LLTLSWDNRGLAESFAKYLVRRPKNRVGAESTVRRYLRDLSAVFNKYSGRDLEERVRNHFFTVAKVEITPKFGLRVEPKRKDVLNPTGFTYLAHFSWVRDRTTFKIGLDRLDDSLIRSFLMWTGCRRHELVYAPPKNHQDKIKNEYYGESDAYTDQDDGPDEYITQPRPAQCWVCDDRLDDRTHNPKLRVLCWEDIDLWIMHDPMGDGGRDCLAMQILLRFHKGADNEMVPTWFPIVEEKLPVLCPISQLLAKALAEGVIDSEGYDTRAEPFFKTKISMPAVHIPWKKEFWHKPVFRQTVESVEGPEKSDEPLTAKMFDNNSGRVGQAAGLPANFPSYVYRRGNLEILDSKSPLRGNPTLANTREENYRPSIRDQGARHKPNSAVFQRFYNNAKRDASAQNAGLGRGTHSPYLDVLSHIGVQYDENAPMGVSDEMMHAIGPDSTVRRLEREWSELEAELQATYGKSTKATGADKKRREQKWNELRAARQKQRRTVGSILRKDHFKKRNAEELNRQLLGIHTPQQPLQKVIFNLPERRLLADILGDLDEDLPEDDIVRRKIDSINGWVAYAWKIEPKEPTELQAPSAEVAKQVEAPPAPRRTIAPKPWYASMIQDPVSPPAPMPMPADAAVIQTPPPPYTPVANSGSLHAATPGGQSCPPPVSRESTPEGQHECIFCGRRFTRKGTMWNCTERHLMRRRTEAVPCPVPTCKSKGIVLEDEMRFKHHAKVVHGRDLRPKITIRTRTAANPPESLKSTPKIVLTRRQKSTPSPRIILRVGKRPA